jgi:2'-5' RNA ligase
MKRLFAAIDLSREVVDSIQSLQKAFREQLDASMRIRWTPPENMHVTLKFLGATEADLVDPVGEMLESHAASIEPFEMEVAGLGAFPRPNQPRVLWAGIDAASNDRLRRFHESFEGELEESFDIDEDEHAFEGHVTFGRVKSSHSPNLAELESQLPRGPFGAFEVDEFLLYESERTPDGAEYTIIRRASLGG